MVFLKDLRTPLLAAFFCVALNACTTSDSPPYNALAPCPEQTTSIAGVQGVGDKSPMQDRQVIVHGVVTLIQNDKGLYIEQPDSDTDQRSSNALYIQATALPVEVETGSLISAKGTVSELGDGRDPLTALTGTNDIKLCSSGHALPVTDVSLPLDSTAREALEGMRIRFNDALTVSDVYRFERGMFTLSSSGIQYVPTEVMQPGPATADLIAQNRNSALPVLLPDHTGFPKLLVNGASVDQLSGVLAHDDRGKRISLDSIGTFSKPDIESPPAAYPGSLRVVAMNLHNYFNGDGKGQGFPTPRGAETLDEFQHQRDRIGAAIAVLDPHVLAVMELENNGFGEHSAAQDFIRLAERASPNRWAVARPVDDNTGSDKIAVGIFYRSDQLKALDAAQTLTGPEFERSRQPQAQLFQRLPDGETILIVINHLKSKGSCPESGVDARQNDGQGCWNAMRRAAAEKMTQWAKSIAASYGTDNILILGDMNAYRNEDPIGAIRKAGFTELMESKPLPTHSFVYSGQHGSLDYAFSSDALLDHVEQAYIWHVNTVFPAKVELPLPWLGFSDHDPVVVELSLRQSSTSD